MWMPYSPSSNFATSHHTTLLCGHPPQPPWKPTHHISNTPPNIGAFLTSLIFWRYWATCHMDIVLSLLRLYVSMWGRDMLLTLLWLWHPPTGSPFHTETHLTPLSFHLLTRQSLYINTLLTLPGPGYLVPGLALVCIPAPSHSGFSPCSATLAYHPPTPPYSHTYMLRSI